MIAGFSGVKRLGAGSFGTVFSAVRNSDGLSCVVKQIQTQGAGTEAETEVSLLASLQHPHVVRYHDSFHSDGALHIVMECCDGGDMQGMLARRVAAGLELSAAEVWCLFLQLALGLEFIHRRHVLHRDLKTANIFLCSGADESGGYCVKLGDFGVARELGTGSMARTLIGTPMYLSPELCEDKPYDQKSDLWALGVILYECLSMDTRPFDASNQCALILKIVEASFTPPTRPCGGGAPRAKLGGEEWKGLLRVVNLLLQKRPADRPEARDILEFPEARQNAEVGIHKFTKGATEQLNWPSHTRLWRWGDRQKLPRCELEFAVEHDLRKVVCSGGGDSEDSRVILGLSKGGSLLVWGTGEEGRLGLGRDVNSRKGPTKVICARAPDESFADICCSYSHSVAVSGSGTIWTWGAIGPASMPGLKLCRSHAEAAAMESAAEAEAATQWPDWAKQQAAQGLAAQQRAAPSTAKVVAALDAPRSAVPQAAAAAGSSNPFARGVPAPDSNPFGRGNSAPVAAVGGGNPFARGAAAAPAASGGNPFARGAASAPAAAAGGGNPFARGAAAAPAASGGNPFARGAASAPAAAAGGGNPFARGAARVHAPSSNPFGRAKAASPPPAKLIVNMEQPAADSAASAPAKNSPGSAPTSPANFLQGGLQASNVFPTRFMVKLEPPTIVLEFTIAPTGETHLLRIKLHASLLQKAFTDAASVADRLHGKYEIYLSKVPKAQIVSLLERLCAGVAALGNTDGGASSANPAGATGAAVAKAAPAESDVDFGLVFVPLMVTALAHVRIETVSCGSEFSAGIDEGGALFMWGENSAGQLGQGHTDTVLQPCQVTRFDRDGGSGTSARQLVRHVSCGDAHVLAICVEALDAPASMATVFSWGDSSFGRLGVGDDIADEGSALPLCVEELDGRGVTAIAAGRAHCAAVCDGDLYTWGLNSDSQLGLEASPFVSSPSHGAAYGGGGGYGSDDSDEDDEEEDDRYESLPTCVRSLRDIDVTVVSAACGDTHTACIDINGSLYTAGNGTAGMLGHGDEQSRGQFTSVQNKFARVRASAVSCSSSATLVLTEPHAIGVGGASA